MKALLIAAAALFLSQSALAATCEEMAVSSKDGKPLTGAAKAASIKKCEADKSASPAQAACAEKAVGKNGKPLAGAAKTSFMKKCEADAAAAK
jgi:hypothetical protein